MILFSTTRLIFLVGYVAAININLRDACGSNSSRCTISNCEDEKFVIESSESMFSFREIVFTNCFIPTFPSTVFPMLPNLERFLMYKCSLKSLTQFNSFAAENLRSLYLPNNRLTELQENLFANLTNIEEIRLANNHISIIHPKAFKGLTKLRFLELNNNKIHELPTVALANLTALEYIDLSFNDIDTIVNKLFESNLHLKTIILSNNKFVVFDSNILAHLPHLSVLDISYNNINSIWLQSVDTLRASSAQLRACVINGSVHRIRASHNQLETISVTDKSSVKEIDVHNNQFASLSDFDGMVNLQKLDVSKNPVRDLRGSNTTLLLHLPSLQFLNIAYGHLQNLTEENFVLLGKLTHLDIAYNSLSQLDANLFEPLANLEKFVIEGNHLESFDYEIFIRNHANIKEMAVFKNDWSQVYLKQMTEVLKANAIKLVSSSSDGSEVQSIQTAAHFHHAIHAKPLDRSTKITPGVTKRDVLIIVTLCLVLLILILQLFRVLRDENVTNLFNHRTSRTVRPRRLDEEESEPL